MYIKLASKGAEILELKLHDSDHNWVWTALDPWKRSSPLLFPIVGRLKGDRFHLKGREYTLSQHGFARDSEFVLFEKTEKCALFRLQASEATLKSYPFHFELDIEYTVEGQSLQIVYTVRNQDHERMYFNIGWHPAFVLPGQASMGMTLRSSAGLDSYHQLKDGLITEEAYSVESMGGVLPLAPAIFSRDALVFLNCRINQVELKDILGNSVEVKIEAPHLGLWTKDISKFLCIEPWWGYADSDAASGDFEEKTDVQILEPGESWTGQMAVVVRGVQ